MPSSRTILRTQRGTKRHAPRPRGSLNHLLPPALLALFLLALLTLVTLHVFARFGDDSHWVAHTQQVLAAIGTTRSDIQDEETAQRELLLSDSPALRSILQNAVSLVQADQGRLRHLTIDNPVQQRKLAVLSALTVARQRGSLPASRIASANDAVRLSLDGLTAEENRLLRQRVPAAEQAGRTAQVLVLTGLGLVASLLLLVATMGGQYLREQRQIDADLRTSQENLEVRVLQRTSQLEEAGRILAEREQRFRFLADAMPQIVWTTLPDGRVNFYNQRWHDYTGLTLEETDNGGIETVVHPDDFPRISDQGRAATTAQHAYTMEYRLLSRDGLFRWHLGRVLPLRDEAGEISLWVGTGTDIDDYKQVAEALRQTHEALQESHGELEARVMQRTRDLEIARDRVLESESRFRAAIEAMQEGILMQDQEKTVLLSNAVADRILGVSPGALFGGSAMQPAWKVIREDGSDFPPEAFPSDLALRLGQPQASTLMGLHYASGEVTWLSVSAAPLRHIGEEKPYAAVSTFSDITERRLSEEALRQAEEGYRGIFENSAEGIFQTTLEGRFRTINPALARMLGYASPQAVLSEMTDIAAQLYRSPTERDRLRALLLKEERVTGFVTECMRRDGSSVWVSINARLHRDRHGEVEFLEGTMQDITERRADDQRLIDYNIVLEFQKKELEKTNVELERVNNQLETLATLDGLTGLKNHRAFQERMGEEFDRARRYALPLSLIMVDVDKFKDYNDAYGHPAGDEVLRRVARILEGSVRDCDFTARYGGEEFVLILPQTDSEGAYAIAERSRIAIEAFAWEMRPVTASFGMASLSLSLTGSADGAALLAQADELLYLAKANGRNQVVRSYAARGEEADWDTCRDLDLIH